MGTVAISFADLWAYHANERMPLAALSRHPTEHVHGTLEIRVGGRCLPALGYSGPDDVCFNEWVRELTMLAQAMPDASGRHVYDEGEQGQPAYVFEWGMSLLAISVIEGSGGGSSDPMWQAISCDAAEFLTEVNSFLDNLHVALESATGDAGRRWYAAIGADVDPGPRP